MTRPTPAKNPDDYKVSEVWFRIWPLYSIVGFWMYTAGIASALTFIVGLFTRNIGLIGGSLLGMGIGLWFLTVTFFPVRKISYEPPKPRKPSRPLSDAERIKAITIDWTKMSEENKAGRR